MPTMMQNPSLRLIASTVLLTGCSKPNAQITFHTNALPETSAETCLKLSAAYMSSHRRRE